MPFELNVPAILHGGDYNPEQWPESVWDEDVRLMKEAHVNVATVPVFAWVGLQPDEDTYTFEWLDRLVDKLWNGGVAICMATSTASVPAWMDQKYPDILRVDQSGRKVRHGSRHTFCPNSPNFRRLSTALAGRLAERYGKHPAVVVWHVSNEYGNVCYCEQCASAFRTWLAKRYGDLDGVNRAWYTKFWGHTYTDFSQIEPPADGREQSIPALRLDYDRFGSHSLLECYKAERDTIRRHSPDIPITTNMMGTYKPLDYQRWGEEMDIISWDSYPPRGADPAGIAFTHSLMRGCREGAPWLLMEQTPSQQNWQSYNALKRPGVMRLWSYQAMAHGSDSVMYFQWRRGKGGCEQYHGAVVEHAARTDARVFQEVSALGKELGLLGKRTLGARVESKIAVLFDWETWWAVEYSIGPSRDLKYVDVSRRYYDALYGLGIAADVVSSRADLSRYSLVVAPVMAMTTPGLAEKLEHLVAGGATLLTTYFSGMIDETMQNFPNGYPGPLAKLLGIWVEETDVLSPQESNEAVFAAPLGDLVGTYSCGMLCDRIHTEHGARVLATYGSEFYAGEPALTVNTFGKGRAYYAGTQLEPRALSLLLAHLASEAGIAAPLGRQDAGIEIMERKGARGSQFYVLNHNAHTSTVRLPAGSFTDLLTGASSSGRFELAKYGVAILSQ